MPQRHDTKNKDTACSLLQDGFQLTAKAITVRGVAGHDFFGGAEETSKGLLANGYNTEL
jgi:hypothetical protein